MWDLTLEINNLWLDIFAPNTGQSSKLKKLYEVKCYGLISQATKHTEDFRATTNSKFYGFV